MLGWSCCSRGEELNSRTSYAFAFIVIIIVQHCCCCVVVVIVIGIIRIIIFLFTLHFDVVFKVEYEAPKIVSRSSNIQSDPPNVY